MRASPWWWIGLTFKAVVSVVGLLAFLGVLAAFVTALSHSGLMQTEDWMTYGGLLLGSLVLFLVPCVLAVRQAWRGAHGDFD